MRTGVLLAAAIGVALATAPAESRTLHRKPVPEDGIPAAGYDPGTLTYSRRLSQYSNGEGTTAANSTPVTPITPFGGYVVNQYGFGNYVSGPQGFGGYPAGSPGAIIWQQREQWKCQNAPESC